MDRRNRVYYLVNLNQNFKLNGWLKEWGGGNEYDHNIEVLTKNIQSLKITENKQLNKYYFNSYNKRYRKYHENYFELKISCNTVEEDNLLFLLNSLKYCNYRKI